MLLREARPLIGERIWVYSTFSRAAVTAASAAFTELWLLRELEASWSASCCEIARCAASFWARACSEAASSAEVRAAASWASARASSAA